MTAQSKGKVAVKSWQLLPPEIVRHIVTFTLLDVSATAFIPRVWERQDHWLPRMSYTVIRDAKLLEKYMSICSSWGRALETHLFWQHANAVLDPHDVLLQQGRLPARLTPFRHFWYNIYNRSCLPCRINSAVNSYGLCQARRAVRTLSFGNVPCCKDHRKDRFCGVCLSDQDLFIVENEDHETFAGVEFTCRECRSEWLLGACRTAMERDAISSSDWETQDRVRAFIQLGELSIRETIQFAMEKLWLRNHTKYSDMLSQAVAASKFQRRRTASQTGMIYESEEEDPDAEGEVEELEEEEDSELIHFDENGQRVKELAINDWVRNRILDGHWFSPGDQFHRLRNQGINRAWGVVPAVHPCPWNRSPEDIAFDAEPHPDADHEPESELDDVWADMGQLELEGRIHPQPAMAKSEVPDSEALINYAKLAYQRNMRSILFPAMVNIVQKVLVESTMDGRDFFQVLSRYDMGDVARELRDENVWYNGIDWVDRRRQENYRREREAEEKGRERSRAVRHQGEERERGQDRDRDDTSSSSKSEASHMTSPVLSTSTLQTTPSPPPAEKKEYLQISPLIQEEEPEAIEDQDRENENQQQELLASRLKPSNLGGMLSIPISPVLANPTLLPSIPFIPVTLAYMPEQTMATFKAIWMEVCTPVFNCNCTVCTRANWKAVETLGQVALAATANFNHQEISLEAASLEDQGAIVQPIIVPSSDQTSDEGYETFLYPPAISKTASFGGLGGEDPGEVEADGEDGGDENEDEDEAQTGQYDLVAFPEHYISRRNSYGVDAKGKGKSRQIDERAVTPEDEAASREVMTKMLLGENQDGRSPLLLSMPTPTTPRKRVISGTKRSSSELEDEDESEGRRNSSVESEGSARSKRVKTESNADTQLSRISTPHDNTPMLSLERDADVIMIED